MSIAWFMVPGGLRRPRGGGASILTQILPGGGAFYPDAGGNRLGLWMMVWRPARASAAAGQQSETLGETGVASLALMWRGSSSRLQGWRDSNLGGLGGLPGAREGVTLINPRFLP